MTQEEDPANADSGLGSSDYSNGKLIMRLLKLSWRFKYRCMIVIILQVVMLILGISGLGFTGLGIDYLRHIVEGATVPPWPFDIAPPEAWSPVKVMAVISGAVATFALLQSGLNYFYTMTISQLVHVDIVMALRSEVYDKLQRLSFRFFDHNASGSLINRVTGDVQAVRRFIDGVLIQVFIMVLSLGVYLAYMLSIHAPLTIACLATTPLLWIVSGRFGSIVRPAYKRNRELADKMILTFSENMQGINTIKGFNLEGFSTGRFHRDSEAVRDQKQWIFWRVTLFAPFVGFLTQVNLMILLGYGGWLVLQGELAIGTGIVVFAGLLQQFSGQISNIAGVADTIQQSLTGARRVFEILDAPIEIDSKPDAIRLEEAGGAIRFENVEFEFRENDTVLHDVSFSVEPGEVIAIAGATGSGKSALLSLLPRFYDPNEGRVTLDGHDLRDIDLEDLRGNIGLVFQENFLFSNTIASNIAFGHPEATREQIEKAARIACADGFISEMPKGYDTILSESGTNLSGGQRQRLAIARAILLEPTVLILDDPTAAIDPETEHEILEAIEAAIQGRTTFIVAHRLSTLKRADRIILLDEGRITQMGTHDELMDQDGLYRRAIDVQAIDPASLDIIRRRRAREQRERSPS